MNAEELLNRKRPIYFPVYAGGVITFMDKYNHDYELMRQKYNNFPKSFRVWVDEEEDKYFYYPFALFSAFHNANMDAKADYTMDPTKMLLFGDSGGFQVATGKAKPSTWNREKHLAWAEKNASITPILDTPVLTQGVTFNQALEQSYENAKWIAENRHSDSPLRVLNVVSGVGFNVNRTWIDKMAEVELDGWAHGGGIDIVTEYILPICFLLHKGIYSPNMKKPLSHHFFGIGSPSAFVFSSYIQKVLNRLGIPVQISHDSSTASSYIKTATYIVNISMKGTEKFSMSKLDLDLKEKYRELQNSGIHLGCDCPVCKTITEISDIVHEKNFVDYYLFYWMHNVYMQVRFKNHIDFIIDTENFRIFEEMFGKPMCRAFKLIDKMLEKPETVTEDPGNHLMGALREEVNLIMNNGKKARRTVQGTSLNSFFGD